VGVTDSDQILIVAGEASGDLHGGHLVRAFKTLHPELRFEGVGGKQMQEAGVHTLYDIDRMGGMGLFEFVNSLWHHIDIFRTLSREIAKRKYRAAILINYPFFNLKLAKVCKRWNCPALFYISPQIWASRKGRVKTIRENITKMYVILPFEEDLYRKAQVDVEYLGHPFIDFVRPQVSREEALREFGLDSAVKTVGLLPGSRMSEVNYLLDDMLGAAGIIQRELKQCQFLLRSEIRRIAEARRLQIRLGLQCDVAGIAGIFFLGDRVHNVTNQAQGLRFGERVHDSGGGIGNHQHITGMNGLPAADTGAVKSQPLLKHALLQLTDGYREMLPRPQKVHEFQIHHLGAVLLCKTDYLFGCHQAFSLLDKIINQIFFNGIE